MSRRYSDRTFLLIADRESIDLEEDNYPIDVSKIIFLKDDFTKASALRKGRVDRADTCIILSDKGKDGTLSDQDRDARTILTALTIEKINPRVRTFLEILDYSNIQHLELEKVVDEIFVHNEFIGYVISSSVINPGMIEFLSDVLSLKTPARISKKSLPENYKGLRFQEVLMRYKKEFNSIVVGLEIREENSFKVLANPPADLLLRGDEKVFLLETEKK